MTAQELKTAATRLRAAFADVETGPPWSLCDAPGLIVSGDVRPWGAPSVAERAYEGDAAWIALMDPALAEPLAACLEEAARLAQEHKPDPNYEGGDDHQWCLECNTEHCDQMITIGHALAIAKVINRSGP